MVPPNKQMQVDFVVHPGNVSRCEDSDDSPPRQHARGRGKGRAKGCPREICFSANKDQSKGKKKGSAEKVGCCRMRATSIPPLAPWPYSDSDSDTGTDIN